MSEVTIRPIRPEDSIEEITALLNLAYKKNADMNLHFVASHQGPEITKGRLEKGTTFIAEFEGRIVGTITLSFPAENPYGGYATTTRLASLGQFAVEPGLQNGGIGRRLIDAVEKEAINLGAEEIGLDTAQGATHLITYYKKLGYEIKAEADWRPEVNYQSWVMVKSLSN